MKKLLILFVGLLWASLLLISWSGPATSSVGTDIVNLTEQR